LPGHSGSFGGRKPMWVQTSAVFAECAPANALTTPRAAFLCRPPFRRAMRFDRPDHDQRIGALQAVDRWIAARGVRRSRSSPQPEAVRVGVLIQGRVRSAEPAVGGGGSLAVAPLPPHEVASVAATSIVVIRAARSPMFRLYAGRLHARASLDRDQEGCRAAPISQGDNPLGAAYW
jgi:hypothetical protein